MTQDSTENKSLLNLRSCDIKFDTLSNNIDDILDIIPNKFDLCDVHFLELYSKVCSLHIAFDACLLSRVKKNMKKRSLELERRMSLCSYDHPDVLHIRESTGVSLALAITELIHCDSVLSIIIRLKAYQNDTGNVVSIPSTFIRTFFLYSKVDVNLYSLVQLAEMFPRAFENALLGKDYYPDSITSGVSRSYPLDVYEGFGAFFGRNILSSSDLREIGVNDNSTTPEGNKDGMSIPCSLDVLAKGLFDLPMKFNAESIKWKNKPSSMERRVNDALSRLISHVRVLPMRYLRPFCSKYDLSPNSYRLSDVVLALRDYAAFLRGRFCKKK